MDPRATFGSPGSVEPCDRDRLEEILRSVFLRSFPGRFVDDLEVRHLIRVITECSLLLTDVYSEDRIARIMHPDRGELLRLVGSLIERERQGEGEVLYRVRRLPDEVRVIGDKALFDLGLRGLRHVKGLDLSDLGSRAYRLAGETLELLAEDRRLREFFRQNRLLMLPLEEEVTFLRQCSEKFPLYADVLKRMHDAAGSDPPTNDGAIEKRLPLMAAAAEALVESDRNGSVESEAGEAPDPYLEAARGDLLGESLLSRNELICAYERLLLFSALDIERLRDALVETVIDQEEAVRTLCNEFGLMAAGTGDLRRPPAFFLVGPTGVGKNHLVETLARLLEGIWEVEVPVLTIEGPNYTYPSDINELRGATRGFIRSDEDGLLGTFHERSSKSPLAIILVDEVEKAHSQLRQFFLSIMDRGTITDNRGRVLNFANALIFFTSNLGFSDAQQSAAPIGYMDEASRTDVSDKGVRRDLRRALTPEFMNRLRLVYFNRLTPSSAERILDLELDRIRRRYLDVHGMELEVDSTAREELIRRGFSPVYGARHLASTLEAVCNVEIAKRIRRDDSRDRRELGALIDWLREMRTGERAFDVEEVRRKVLDLTRARLGYARIRVVFEDGDFEYVPVTEG